MRSKDTTLELFGIFCCFCSGLINSLVFFIVYWDVLRDDKSWASYFESSYDVVLMFEMIGCIGDFSIAPLLFNLYVLAVSYNLVNAEPGGYYILYS